MRTFSSRNLARAASVSVALVVFGTGATALAFVEPAGAPPSGNVPAPVNVGSGTQYKAGFFGIDMTGNPSHPLEVWGVGLDGVNAIFGNGSVGIGTTVVAPNSLTIGPSGGNYQLCLNGTDTNNCLAGNDISMIRNVTVSGTNYWALAGNNLTPTSTAYNVGIGTLSPSTSYKLDVAGDAHTSGNIYQENGKGLWAKTVAGTSQQWMWPRWTNDWMYLNMGPGGWIIRDSASVERIRITAAGSVGIGTANPSQKLDVVGTVAADYVRIDPQNTIDEGGELQLVGAGTYGTLYLDNYAGNARIHTLAAGKQFQVIGGQIRSDAGYCISTSCITAWPTAGTNYFGLTTTWAANDTIYNSQAGTAALKVQGGSGTGYVMAVGGNTVQAGYIGWHKPTGVRMAYMGWDPTNLNLNLENGANFLITNGNTTVSSGNVTANQFCFNAGGCITSIPGTDFWGGSLTGTINSLNTGNVGIGTASPRQKLDVNGLIAFGPNNGLIYDDQGTGRVAIRSGTGTTNKFFTFGTDGVFSALNGGGSFNGNVAITGSARATAGVSVGASAAQTGDGTIRVNQGWSPTQEVAINSNQIWKSNTTGDLALYLQYSTAGGDVIIGQNSNTNNLVDYGTTYARQFCILGGTCTSNFATAAPGGAVGAVQFNNSGSFGGATNVFVGANANGAIELGPSAAQAATPFIDFHYGGGGDYNVRLINDVSGRLSIVGGDLSVGGGEITGIAGGVGIGSVSSGWYSDTANLAARVPNGDFYVQNSAVTPATYFRAGAASGGAQVSGKMSVSGKIGTSGLNPDSGYPAGWGGGIHTWDVQADGSINANGSIYGAAFIYNSDIRLKKNVQPLEGNLSKVLQLQPVSYNWIDSNKSPTIQPGFIAQDVEKVIPEIVHTNASSTIKGVDYVLFAPVLVGSVQELNQKIEAQQKQIAAQQEQIDVLMEKFEALSNE